ncbi:hypothetical protein [Paenibacillus apiarius]|uniref:Uncharacterized protein n=1 Tax=Paenibacillus apiarius TaxID=46240 RepID=A0ABT4DWD1_9BACL|nr:hypothetical protein [Paenibacillus apiarius]MCY9517684.1 hypothetical protein [Paenibacillus apiarius]MCY9521663.1 hypothetical protein [Paenibacillus apiarius]MCY9555341.1 hypothetical protein [Paenibacillus apiarius]MCY9561221.1 hypothetical protein [Paenibacillus apiarius]MCY9686364.1 hypothetical protein [Paenibacillus apiarius]
MRRKINAGLLVAAAALLLMTGWSDISGSHSQTFKTISIHANFVNFENADQLDSFADLIVIGTAVQRFEDRNPVSTHFDDGTLQDFYTLTDISIDRVLKGPGQIMQEDAPLTIIEPLAYLDIENEKTKLTRENYIELHEGDRSVIFLKKNTFGQYAIINQNLGKFSLNETPEFQVTADSEEAAEYAVLREDVFEKYGLN